MENKMFVLWLACVIVQSLAFSLQFYTIFTDKIIDTKLWKALSWCNLAISIVMIIFDANQLQKYF